MQHELQNFELTLDQMSCKKAMHNFQFLLNKCAEKFVSTKICKGTKNKKLLVNNEIKHLATKKRQQYQNFMRKKDKNDQLKFNALRNKLQKLIRRKKETYYQLLINADGQKNSKSFCDCNSRLKGKVATQDRLNKETADKFIDYFSSVGKILASKFESKKEKVSKSSSISVQSMRLTSAILLEVREIINKMQTKCSTDCFELNNFFLKKLECLIVPILTKLINKFIDEGSFPPCLKEAIIVALHKKGDVQEASNFRPTSLLLTVSKVFETYIYNKISNFLEFFDTVDDNLLLRQIANIGLRGPMLEIMKSYLSDRKQTLRYGAARTSPRTIFLACIKVQF